MRIGIDGMKKEGYQPYMDLSLDKDGIGCIRVFGKDG
jgi:hypothetical protein